MLFAVITYSIVYSFIHIYAFHSFLLPTSSGLKIDTSQLEGVDFWSQV